MLYFGIIDRNLTRKRICADYPLQYFLFGSLSPESAYRIRQCNGVFYPFLCLHTASSHKEVRFNSKKQQLSRARNA